MPKVDKKLSRTFIKWGNRLVYLLDAKNTSVQIGAFLKYIGGIMFYEQIGSFRFGAYPVTDNWRPINKEEKEVINKQIPSETAINLLKLIFIHGDN